MMLLVTDVHTEVGSRRIQNRRFPGGVPSGSATLKLPRPAFDPHRQFVPATSPMAINGQFLLATDTSLNPADSLEFDP